MSLLKTRVVKLASLALQFSVSVPTDRRLSLVPGTVLTMKLNMYSPKYLWLNIDNFESVFVDHTPIFKVAEKIRRMYLDTPSVEKPVNQLMAFSACPCHQICFLRIFYRPDATFRRASPIDEGWNQSWRGNIWNNYKQFWMIKTC